jgi:hypothetical protein
MREKRIINMFDILETTACPRGYWTNKYLWGQIKADMKAAMFKSLTKIIGPAAPPINTAEDYFRWKEYQTDGPLLALLANFEKRAGLVNKRTEDAAAVQRLKTALEKNNVR